MCLSCRDWSSLCDPQLFVDPPLNQIHSEFQAPFHHEESKNSKTTNTPGFLLGTATTELLVDELLLLAFDPTF